MGQDQETPAERKKAVESTKSLPRKKKSSNFTRVVPSPDRQGLWNFWPRCLSEQRRWASKLANKCGICSRVIASSILRGPKVRCFTTKLLNVIKIVQGLRQSDSWGAFMGNFVHMETLPWRCSRIFNYPWIGVLRHVWLSKNASSAIMPCSSIP